MWVWIASMTSGRHSRWGEVARSHLLRQPRCMVCGNAKNLQVHHIRPFHLFPELELDPGNLLTLCVAGPGHMNCHLVVGHRGVWARWNDQVEKDAATFRSMLRGNVMTERDEATVKLDHSGCRLTCGPSVHGLVWRWTTC